MMGSNRGSDQPMFTEAVSWVLGRDPLGEWQKPDQQFLRTENCGQG